MIVEAIILAIAIGWTGYMLSCGLKYVGDAIVMAKGEEDPPRPDPPRLGRSSNWIKKGGFKKGHSDLLHAIHTLVLE